jgi:thiamine pyrophosphate-dependent acetolactate synthase large subunit-like protein
MADRTGRHAIIEQFLADDIHYMFGNPGTVEQGFLDAVRDFSNLKYINTLQETIAVAIADGYARAIKRPAVVQLHSGVGLGIRFDELAKGMGVPAVRVEKPDQGGPAIRICYSQPCTRSEDWLQVWPVVANESGVTNHHVF